MVLDISRQYVGRKASLIERIRNRAIEVLEDNEAILVFEGKLAKSDLVCYFCGEYIDGKLRVLEDVDSINGVKLKSYYPIDAGCYANAKGIHIVKPKKLNTTPYVNAKRC